MARRMRPVNTQSTTLAYSPRHSPMSTLRKEQRSSRTVKKNVEPLVPSLPAHIVPPISSLSCLLIASPSPLPSRWRDSVGSSWLKG